MLFCAWLAWSSFRVVLALRDKTAPSVFAALDVTLRRLGGAPTYVLTDGFPIGGLPSPTLAVWKGDRVAACVAAASVLAKVTRDRIMRELHERWPEYDFARHKGYSTPEHTAALSERGPCPEHRFSYVNVRSAVLGLDGPRPESQPPGPGGQRRSAREEIYA